MISDNYDMSAVLCGALTSQCLYLLLKSVSTGTVQYTPLSTVLYTVQPYTVHTVHFTITAIYVLMYYEYLDLSELLLQSSR